VHRARRRDLGLLHRATKLATLLKAAKPDMSVALNPTKVRGATLLPMLRLPDTGPQHRTLATDARLCASAAPRLL